MKILRYIFVIFLFFTHSVTAQHISEDYKKLTTSILSDRSEGQDPKSIESAPDLFLVFYQNIISPQDNSSCPFDPNCSEFSRQILHNEGLTGYMLAFDRLLRCNGLPGMYENYPLDESRERFLDPVDNYSSSE